MIHRRQAPACCSMRCLKVRYELFDISTSGKRRYGRPNCLWVRVCVVISMCCYGRYQVSKVETIIDKVEGLRAECAGEFIARIVVDILKMTRIHRDW